MADTQRMTDAEKLNDLLSAALLCNLDRCPPDPTFYFCGKSEDYEDSICERCWSSYFFQLVRRD